MPCAGANVASELKRAPLADADDASALVNKARSEEHGPSAKEHVPSGEESAPSVAGNLASDEAHDVSGMANATSAAAHGVCALAGDVGTQESYVPAHKTMVTLVSPPLRSQRGDLEGWALPRARGDMANAKKDGHPKKDFNAVTQTGLKALALAEKHHDALVPRLPAGMVDRLTADLSKLGADVPGALVTRSTAKTATVSQNEALAAGYSLVTGIRTAVQRRGAAAEVRKGYGVGAKINPKVVKQVAAAIRVILERAAAMPGEAAGLGILQKDLGALGDDLAAILSADGAQEEKRAGAPTATKERNRTANRILEAVDVIVSAGVLEFAKDGEVRGAFEALVSGGGGGKGKSKGKKGDGGAGKDGAAGGEAGPK